MSHDDQACEVPFTEQLRDVPNDFRATREIQWATDGTPTGHQFIPVGFMFHRAADEIDRLNIYLADARKVSDRWAAEALKVRAYAEKRMRVVELARTWLEDGGCERTKYTIEERIAQEDRSVQHGGGRLYDHVYIALCRAIVTAEKNQPIDSPKRECPAAPAVHQGSDDARQSAEVNEGSIPSGSAHSEFETNHQPGSLPPRFKKGDGSFEDWYEGYFYGCVRPDGRTTEMLRHAFEGAPEELRHQSCTKSPTPRTDEAVARGMRDPDNWASLARELEARTEFQVGREGFDSRDKNGMESLERWLRTRSMTVWAKQFGHSGLMAEYAEMVARWRATIMSKPLPEFDAMAAMLADSRSVAGKKP